MIHDMHLDAQYFDEVRAGKKTVELRLNDEKRQKVAVGDTLLFRKRGKSNELLQVLVIKRKGYATYENLVGGTPLPAFGPRWASKSQLLQKGWTHHSLEEQKKWGFVVFYIQPL